MTRSIPGTTSAMIRLGGPDDIHLGHPIDQNDVGIAVHRHRLGTGGRVTDDFKTVGGVDEQVEPRDEQLPA